MRLHPIVLGLALFSGACKGAFAITNHASVVAVQLRGGFDGQAWLGAFHQGGHTTTGDVASKRVFITRAFRSTQNVAGSLGTAVSLHPSKLVRFCVMLCEK
jgi:hypothetical protein